MMQLARSFSLRRTMRAFLVVSLLATAPPVNAERSIASVRLPPQKASLRPLSARERRILQRAALDLIVKNYQRARSFAAFDQQILSQFPERDRHDLEALFKDTANWPTAHRVGDKILFEQGRERLVFGLPDPSRPVMVFNGMTWTFNGRQPFAYQLELALKSFSYQKRSSSALVRFAIPEAIAQDAVAPAAGAAEAAAADAASGVAAKAGFFSRFAPRAVKVVSAVTGWRLGIAAAAVTTAVSLGVTSMVDTATCHFIAGGTLETEWGFCYDWRKNLDDGRKRRAAGLTRVDALEKDKNLQEENDVLKWVPDMAKACMTLSDKTKSLYVIDFLELKRGAGDAWEKDGDWFSVVQKYNPDGKPAQFMITAKGTDTADPNWQDKAEDTLLFEDGHLSAILYKNKDYNFTDPGSPRYLRQEIANSNDGTLSDVQASRQNAMVALVRSMNTWANYCSEKKFVENLEKQNVSVENPNPSPQVDPHTLVPTADAPPPTVPNALSNGVSQ